MREEDLFDKHALLNLPRLPCFRRIKQVYYNAVLDALGDRGDTDVALRLNGSNSWGYYYDFCKERGITFEHKYYVKKGSDKIIQPKRKQDANSR